MEQRFDLHNHSAVSKDGVTPGRELLRLAAKQGLAGLAVTDHDAFPDPELPAEAARLGLALAQGVEFSCRRSHILGFGLKPDAEDRAFLQRRFAAMEQGSVEVLREMLKGLAGVGIEVGFDGLRDYAGKTPQKIFLFRYMAEKLGLFPSWADARRFTAEQGLYIHDEAVVEPLLGAEAVELIKRCGGLAVWAHPFLASEETRRQLLPDLLDAGLDGLEAVYGYGVNGYRGSESDAELEVRGRTLAREHGLAVTGGSDSHYPLKTDEHGRPLLPGYKSVGPAEVRDYAWIFAWPGGAAPA